MIPEEQRARIRRLIFAEHWTIGTIAAKLGLHHDTVERAIEPLGMYLRTTKRRNANGSEVRYYQLAESVWDAARGCAVARVV